MYINGRTEAVQGRVAIYKCSLASLPVRAPWEHVALRSGDCCVRRTHRNTIAVWDLCVRSRSCDH
ncbi:unnamed protein product [Staurois parvus]|uniref:Uncharacterized protein n=1 Tax=Staurois parvus TaxID=386267 RepID=A0ABN9HR96_9NEOB|nr:unnamed protein product [Staurois parvus]